MTRKEWLISTYGDALVSKLSDHGMTFDAAGAVSHVMDCDPTRTGRYSQWLICGLINGGFLLEDLFKARETLEYFVEYHRIVPQELRDINQHKSLADLWRVVKPFAENPEEDISLSGKAVKRQEKQRAYEQSVVVIEDDEWTVAIPMTEDAAKWWGKGTRWCTSADSHNNFDGHHAHGPLIVIDIKDQGKSQLHLSDSVQFMDSDDARVDPNFIALNWEKLEGLMELAISENASFLQQVPAHLVKREICEMSVRRCGENYLSIPEQYKTSQLALEAIKAYLPLWKLPKKERTREICFETISLHRRWEPTTDHIPVEHLDKEMWIHAVKKDAFSLFYVPVDMLDEEICMAAVLNNSYIIGHRDFPKKILTREFLIKAITEDGKVARDLHHNCEMDLEMALLAVNNGASLKDVRNFITSPEVVMAALKKDGNNLMYTEAGTKTPEMCEIAVTNCPMALQYVPNHLQTEKMCMAAVAAMPNTIRYVDDRFKTKELCEAAFDLHKNLTLSAAYFEIRKRDLQHIPAEHRPAMMAKLEAAMEIHLKNVPLSEEALNGPDQFIWFEDLEFLGKLAKALRQDSSELVEKIGEVNAHCAQMAEEMDNPSMGM